MESEQYCMYLRKSRKDAEAEKRGEGETLSRHKKALEALADRMKLDVTKIFEEVVSGETITDRPQMQLLLKEIENKRWSGVLVIEVERLTRGDPTDQGKIIKTFKYSNTKIITPIKTYDPNNPSDADYLEFGLFMSRREYLTITRRMQEGRSRSIIEGKYVSNKPVYGYERVQLENEQGWTLKPIKEQADIVRDIFGWYTEGVVQEDGSRKRIGVCLIARRLNRLKVKSQSGGLWKQETIRDMLINPVYIGKLRWNWRPAKKRMDGGEVKVERPRASVGECIIADGLHEGIVSEETFNTAQMFMSQNPPRPVGEKNIVKNPLAGLVKCGKCGRNMTRRPYTDKNYPDTLMCAVPGCTTVSVHLHYVEERMLDGLAEWLEGYKLKWVANKTPKRKNTQLVIRVKELNNELKIINSEIGNLNTQLGNLYDLLERRLYNDEIFLKRNYEINQRIQNAEKERAAVLETIRTEENRTDATQSIIPNVENLLAVYNEFQSPAAKNDLLKEVVGKIVYNKDIGGRWNGTPDDFELTLYPILPAFEKY